MRVYKRGNTYTYAFDIKVNGKRKTITKGGFRLKSDAERAGILAQSESQKGVQVHKTITMTYGQYLDKWLTEVYKATVKENTYLQRRGIINSCIKPILGNIKIHEITTADVSAFLNGLVAKGYSKSHIVAVRNTLSKSFNDMISIYNYIQYNPVSHVNINNRLIRKDDNSKQGYILSLDDIAAIRTYLKTTTPTWQVLFEVGLRCGLRFSEAVAISWQDINFDKKELTINKQLKNLKNYGPSMDHPKYDSCGIISLDDELIGILKSYKAYQMELRLKTIGNVSVLIYDCTRRDFFTYDLVFLNSEMEPFGNISKDYYNRCIRKKCNLPKFSYHCLRRTHATMLIASNAPIKAVQERMRHKRVEETLNIYTQVNAEMKEELQRVINSDLFANSKTC